MSSKWYQHDVDSRAHLQRLPDPRSSLAYGLRTDTYVDIHSYTDPDESDTSSCDSWALPRVELLSKQSLEALKELHSLNALPGPNVDDVAYPCFIVAAGADSRTQASIENDAASGAIKALSMLQALYDKYRGQRANEVSEDDCPIAIRVLCCRAIEWKLLLAFRLIVSAPAALLRPW